MFTFTFKGPEKCLPTGAKYLNPALRLCPGFFFFLDLRYTRGTRNRVDNMCMRLIGMHSCSSHVPTKSDNQNAACRKRSLPSSVTNTRMRETATFFEIYRRGRNHRNPFVRSARCTCDCCS